MKKQLATVVTLVLMNAGTGFALAQDTTAAPTAVSTPSVSSTPEAKHKGGHHKKQNAEPTPTVAAN